MKKITIEINKRIPKKTIAIRLDEEVIRWFKKRKPEGYTSMMSDILKAYRENFK